tara:strand:+ start:230 stop:454 length:225 start_codon:yes stop_codon:yes gene_type:complete
VAKIRNPKDRAINLFDSIRGRFIISKALYTAMDILQQEKRPPKSDIQDMKLLAEELFPICGQLEAYKDNTRNSM